MAAESEGKLADQPNKLEMCSQANAARNVEQQCTQNSNAHTIQKKVTFTAAVHHNSSIQ